jgi:hypothetical protein
MYKAKQRNNAIPGVDGQQYKNTCMSAFDANQRWCFVPAQDVDGVWTHTLATKGTHHSAI